MVVCLAANCRNENSSKTINASPPSTQINGTTIANGIYNVKLVSAFYSDTLDIVDYREDMYSSPIISDQYFEFYKGDELIRHYQAPVKSIIKNTTTNHKLAALQTPIYKVCIINKNYYLAFGSDYCNGSECPEFTGIYSMKGDVIFEGVTSKEQDISLKNILIKYKLNINAPERCINIDPNLFGIKSPK